MFNVGRFDPRQEEKKAKKRKDKKKKHKRQRELAATPTTGDNNNNVHDDKKLKQEVPPPTTTLREIAPEARLPLSIKRKVEEEAFDDLDLTEDVIIENINNTQNHEEEEQQGQHDDENQESNNHDKSEIDVSDEIQVALAMSKKSIQEAATAWGLASFLVDNLHRDGYKNFFPIQALVIPDVISTERHSHLRARDVCVGAPTGSGKTLAFVIPVLNALAKRQIRRLRALVILPSRDLAKQVYDVFDRYTNGSDLIVGLSVGQSDFYAEQKTLTVDANDRKSSVPDSTIAKLKCSFDPGNTQLSLNAFPHGCGDEGNGNCDGIRIPRGGISAVDILVCTPGRLVDHLDNTPGFTLQHLRFLIIDEADRLLSQRYHNWIERVIDGANAASVGGWYDIEKTKTRRLPRLTESDDGCSFVIDPITWRRGGVAGDASTSFSTNDAYTSVVASVCQQVQLRKLLYSATLTKDPRKLASLRLINPKHFDAHHLRSSSSSNKNGTGTVGAHLYTMPTNLAEHTVECTAEQKPIVLLALLLDQINSQEATQPSKQNNINDNDNTIMKNIIVVFTSSVDSTHRLTRLLQLLWHAAGYGDSKSIAEYSSLLNQNQRSKLITRCNDSSDVVSVVVCSDGMSRGMDIDYVSAVINYDVPSFAKTYVHRCGRTARAGRAGVAISLLKGGQVGAFAKMRRLIENPTRVSSMGVKKGLVKDAIPHYRQCVKQLREVLEQEKDGELQHWEDITSEKNNDEYNL